MEFIGKNGFKNKHWSWTTGSQNKINKQVPNSVTMWCTSPLNLHLLYAVAHFVEGGHSSTLTGKNP